MPQFYEPGEPVELDVLDDDETMWHVDAFFPELERPIHMAVVATGRDAAREQVIEFARRTIAGVTQPPTVAVHTLEEWLTR